MMTFDTSLFFALNNLANRSRILDLLIIFFGQYFGYIVTIIFLIAVWRGRERYAVFSIPIISALVARFGITELVRFFYHRPRPFVTYHVHQLLSDNAWSFPSGHATFFFALATGVYFSNKKLGVALFLATILITAGRVIAGVHYPSDILGGMLIGIASAYAVRHVVKLTNAQKHL